MTADDVHEPADDGTYEAPALTSLGTTDELAGGNEDNSVTDTSPT